MNPVTFGYLAPRRLTHPRLRHRGFTLIEMVIVVVLVGILLSLCAATLNRAYEVHRTALHSFRELEQINYWCQRLRSDAHQATQVKVDAQAEFVRSDSEAVRYLFEGEQWLRIVQRDAQVVTREVWRGPTISAIHWQRDDSGRMPIIHCQVTLASTGLAVEPIGCSARLPNLKDNSPQGDDHVP